MTFWGVDDDLSPDADPSLSYVSITDLMVYFLGAFCGMLLFYLYFSIMLGQFLSRHSPISLLRGFENDFPSQNWHWLKVDFFIYYKSCVHHDITEYC